MLAPSDLAPQMFVNFKLLSERTGKCSDKAQSIKKNKKKCYSQTKSETSKFFYIFAKKY